MDKVEPVQGKPCRGEVTAVLDLSEQVREIRIRLIDPTEIDFFAGQYITLCVTETDTHPPEQKNRHYSIVSPPEEKTSLSLCVNRVGTGSTHIHALKVGDPLLFLSPIGYFQVDETATTPLLFIATGTGIAPIKSIIDHLLRTGCPRAIQLCWGLRDEKDLYYQDCFSEWASRYPTFQYATTLSNGSPAWTGMRGRVMDHLPQLVSADNPNVYLCGNGEMIQKARDLLLSKGVPREAIHFEKFY
jgi:ferredoxin-NADP reductase